MARLPQPGKDTKIWGNILNEYLLVAHNTDGTLRQEVVDHRALKPFAVSASNIAAGSPKDGQVLVVDSSQPGGLIWKTPSEISSGVALAPVSTTTKTASSRTGATMTAAAAATDYLNLVGYNTAMEGTPAILARSDASPATGSGYYKILDVMAPNMYNSQWVQICFGRSRAVSECGEINFQAKGVYSQVALGFYGRMSIFAFDYSGNFTYYSNPDADTTVAWGERKNFVFGTTTGTKIGTDATQKLSFYGATPITQPSGDVATALSNLGLVSNPTVNVNMASLTGTAALATRGGYEKAVVTTSPTLDLTLGNVFQVTLGANATFVFNNPAPSGYASSFSLYVKQDATGNRTVAWPTSVRWSGGKPAASTGANSIDLYVFETFDGGATWYGAQAGSNFAA